MKTLVELLVDLTHTDYNISMYPIKDAKGHNVLVFRSEGQMLSINNSESVISASDLKEHRNNLDSFLIDKVYDLIEIVKDHREKEKKRDKNIFKFTNNMINYNSTPYNLSSATFDQAMKGVHKVLQIQASKPKGLKNWFRAFKGCDIWYGEVPLLRTTILICSLITGLGVYFAQSN